MLTDAKSLKLLNQLDKYCRQDAIDAMEEACRITPKGVHPTVTETYRSFERSDALYNQPWDGKDNDGDGKIDEADEKVTKAKGGQSYHNFALALDFTMIVNDKVSWKVDENWMKVVKVFKKYGFKWGGDSDFGIYDAPHFQKSPHRSSELLRRYRAGLTYTENGIKYVKL